MPTLKKRSGNASRNGRMSVYLPRSAVSPTISGRFCAKRWQARGRTARRPSAAAAAGFVLAHGERSCRRAHCAAPTLCSNSAMMPSHSLTSTRKKCDFSLVSMRATPLPGKRAQDDRLRLAVLRCAPASARRRRRSCRCRRSRSPPSRRRAICRRPAPCRARPDRRPGCRCSRSAPPARRARNGWPTSPPPRSSLPASRRPTVRRRRAPPTSAAAGRAPGRPPWPSPWPSEPPISSTPGVVSSVDISSRLSSAP